MTRADLHVTGACIGIDQLVASMLAMAEQRQRIIVPFDRSRVDTVWLGAIGQLETVELVWMPPGSSYRDRNQAILGEPDALPAGVIPHRVNIIYGFPQYPEADPRSARSGTWQTVRMARRMGLNGQVYVLEPSLQAAS